MLGIEIFHSVKPMRNVPLVRATHLNVYLDVLREIGAPVDRTLRSAGLPATIEETPDLYLCVPRVLECVSANGGAEAAMEFGYIAAQRSKIENLRPQFQRDILAAPSCLARLQALVRHAAKEDGALVTQLRPEGASVRVICDLAQFRQSPALAYSEWLQLQAIVLVVQSVAGPKWRPEEMTFVSSHEPSAAAYEIYGNTRILLSQRHTSVLVPRSLIGYPCPTVRVTVGADTGQVNEGSEAAATAGMIREILKAYLPDRPLLAAELAELLGTTGRTLQRHLQNQGLTYAQLVAEARYQVACTMLSGSDSKMIDIAFATGYEDPSHFSRAFRRIAGVSPRQYRAAARRPAPAVGAPPPA